MYMYLNVLYTNKKLHADWLGLKLGPEVIKNFRLNSAEHEILNAHKYKNIKKFSFFQAQISLECCFFSCS